MVNASSLNGLTERNGQQDYPFMLSDGTTLYFAENGEESLGGYDLFVTRYSSSSHEYLKPENLGMPFNSPYNDYMLVIDEPNNLDGLPPTAISLKERFAYICSCRTIRKTSTLPKP